jgi:hypothetical protein
MYWKVDEETRLQSLREARTNNDETGEDGDVMAKNAGQANLQPQNGIGDVFWYRFKYMLSLTFTSYNCEASKWLYANLFCHLALAIANIYLSDLGGLLIDTMIVGNYDDPLLDEYLAALYCLTFVFFLAGTLACYSGQMMSLMVRAAVTKEFHRRYWNIPYWLNILYWNISTAWIFCTGTSLTG